MFLDKIRGTTFSMKPDEAIDQRISPAVHDRIRDQNCASLLRGAPR